MHVDTEIPLRHTVKRKVAPHSALCLTESSLQVADFLVVALLTALLGLLKLFLMSQVLLEGFFGLLELPLELLNLALPGLSLRLN